MSGLFILIFTVLVSLVYEFKMHEIKTLGSLKLIFEFRITFNPSPFKKKKKKYKKYEADRKKKKRKEEGIKLVNLTTSLNRNFKMNNFFNFFRDSLLRTHADA